MSGPTEDRIIEIDGLPVHYREAGDGETVVYLHGAGGAPLEGPIQRKRRSMGGH